MRYKLNRRMYVDRKDMSVFYVLSMEYWKISYGEIQKI